jgi:hypothetical protein
MRVSLAVFLVFLCHRDGADVSALTVVVPKSHDGRTEGAAVAEVRDGKQR